MKTKLIFILLFFCFIAKSQYNDVQGNLFVLPILDDTVIKVPVDNQSTITGSKGYFYFDYTDLSATDGKIEIGSIIYCGGLEKFIPWIPLITLSNDTTEITIDGVDIYMYENVDGDTTWQIASMFEYFPGDIPAFKYIKVSADTGFIRYRYKSILK